MNRIDRVSAILIQLQSKKIVSAEEIARRFEISKRTVYRDLKALEEAGVPVGAEPGKGYFLIEGYHLPPVMFTNQEASAMLTAEKMVEKLGDHSLHDQFKSAMYKIKAVLPEKEKNFLERLDHNIEILHFRPRALEKAPDNYLLDIQQALVNQRMICIDYQSGYNEKLITDRLIEPIGLCFYSLGWHLLGYCRFRNDYRDFRIDRIMKLSLTDQPFVAREITSVKEFFTSVQESYKLEKVIIRFPKTAAGIIQTTRYYYGFISEETDENYIYQHYLVNDLEYFSRWILSFSDMSDVVLPQKLKDILGLLIEKVKKRFP